MTLAYCGNKGRYAHQRNREKYTQKKAYGSCHKHKAVLVIAKLDRLARNVHFISGLMESGVEFVAVDMPEASRLTIHILAAVAEHERVMISQRTKAALQAAKARGTKLGSPTPKNGAAVRSRVLQEKAVRFASGIQPIVKELEAQGIISYKAIARALNMRGVPTANNRQWYGGTVKNILESRTQTAEEMRSATLQWYDKIDEHFKKYPDL